MNPFSAELRSSLFLLVTTKEVIASRSAKGRTSSLEDSATTSIYATVFYFDEPVLRRAEILPLPLPHPRYSKMRIDPAKNES
jgi:hypothetical protein